MQACLDAKIAKCDPAGKMRIDIIQTGKDRLGVDLVAFGKLHELDELRPEFTDQLPQCFFRGKNICFLDIKVAECIDALLRNARLDRVARRQSGADDEEVPHVPDRVGRELALELRVADADGLIDRRHIALHQKMISPVFFLYIVSYTKNIPFIVISVHTKIKKRSILT